jgi:hypothetical protein
MPPAQEHPFGSADPTFLWHEYVDELSRLAMHDDEYSEVSATYRPFTPPDPEATVRLPRLIEGHLSLLATAIEEDEDRPANRLALVSLVNMAAIREWPAPGALDHQQYCQNVLALGRRVLRAVKREDGI